MINGEGALFPHKDVSHVFPPCPSIMGGFPYRLTHGASLDVHLGEEKVGTWWPTSSYSMQMCIFKDQKSLHFVLVNDAIWREVSSGKTHTWDIATVTSRKRRRAPSPEMSRTPSSVRRSSNSTRACILPLSPLDLVHRPLLDALGLRVCTHSEIGRVLVTARTFAVGDFVLFCRVSQIPCEDESQVSLLTANFPHGSYLHVPRRKAIYSNPLLFDLSDPIKSGDAWYLVNHSDMANCELKAHPQGLAVRAKKFIRENEPLCWCYNAEFFLGDELCVDLPSTILIDEHTILA